MKNFDYRIYYEDTDAGGVVYYANYLKFFERARTDFLRALGVDQSQLLQQEKIAFVVRKCEINYLKPAKLDDLITISSTISDVKNVSLIFKQEMTLNNQTLATLIVKIACVNVDNFMPTPIPNNLNNLLKNK